MTADGELPRVVDGRDFRAEAARMLDELRMPARLTVTNLSDAVEEVRPHEVLIALQQRSWVQFLIDDFRGTVADGLVDDDLFDDVDEELAARLRGWGPFDFLTPPRTPTSHWW